MKIEAEPSIVQNKEIKVAANSGDNNISSVFSSLINESENDELYANPARNSVPYNS